MTQQIITSIPLIRRYSRHNEAEDYRFRTYLKTGIGMSEKELDGKVQDETNLVWSQIDCTSCGNCCKTLSIVVDSNDIARLASRLRMSQREFTKRHINIVTNELGKKESFLSSTPCQFLDDKNCCTVYEDRPQSCRDFPYLNAPRFRTRTLMMIENLPTCPIVFNVWQRLKDSLWRRRRNSQ